MHLPAHAHFFSIPDPIAAGVEANATPVTSADAICYGSVHWNWNDGNLWALRAIGKSHFVCVDASVFGAFVDSCFLGCHLSVFCC